jgi:hypothetical protein
LPETKRATLSACCPSRLGSPAERFSPRKVNTSTPATPARTRAREDMAIEWREISTLIPYARNARTHSDAQIAEIAGSIREFGFTNPVLIDPEGGIIAGHGRVLAARQLGMAEIPTICLSGLSETQRRAYSDQDAQGEAMASRLGRQSLALLPVRTFRVKDQALAVSRENRYVPGHGRGSGALDGELDRPEQHPELVAAPCFNAL